MVAQLKMLNYFCKNKNTLFKFKQKIFDKAVEILANGGIKDLKWLKFASCTYCAEE